MTQPQGDKKPKPQAARIHPDDRARIEAFNTIGKALTPAPTEKPPKSYYTPELIQCTLPHSDPKTRDWIKKNGNYSLIISSGIDDEGTPYGAPYGSFPRLVLAYIISLQTITLSTWTGNQNVTPSKQCVSLALLSLKQTKEHISRLPWRNPSRILEAAEKMCER